MLKEMVRLGEPDHPEGLVLDDRRLAGNHRAGVRHRGLDSRRRHVRIGLADGRGEGNADRLATLRVGAHHDGAVDDAGLVGRLAREREHVVLAVLALDRVGHELHVLTALNLDRGDVERAARAAVDADLGAERRAHAGDAEHRLRRGRLHVADHIGADEVRGNLELRIVAVERDLAVQAADRRALAHVELNLVLGHLLAVFLDLRRLAQLDLHELAVGLGGRDAEIRAPGLDRHLRRLAGLVVNLGQVHLRGLDRNERLDVGRQRHRLLGKHALRIDHRHRQHLRLRTVAALRIEGGRDLALLVRAVRVLVFSGYSQYDILQKFLFKQSDNIKHVLNLQLSNSSDIPRYDRLTDPDGEGLRNAEWYYGPQLRTLASYELHMDDMNGFFNSYSAGINYQYIEESRNQRRFERTGLQQRTEKVGVFGFGFDARKTTERHDLRIGLEGYFNSLTSTAEETDIETGEVSPLDTRYPDGDNTMNNIGLYATDTWKINDQWVLNGGLRLESIMLHSTFVSKEFFDFPFDEIKQSHLPLSGSLGVIWNGTSDWRIALIGSTGFHAPDVDDLAKVFESAPGSVIVPNPDLEPEKTYNADLNISKIFSDKVKVEVVGFGTLFRDAIVTDEFTYNGEDSIVYDGELSQVLANQNKRKAFLYGVNANIFADITDEFSLVSTITFTKGEIVEDSANSPLDHIPPVIGKTSIVYHHKGFRGELFANYNGWKHIDDYNGGGEDNEQYATPEGMPAWWTLNLRLQYQINKNLLVQAACENILDANYRVFASGISAPGRNFIVTLRGSF